MILPPATLGMLGGGQLGRYFVVAARDMGYRVVVLDPDPHSPAGSLANRHLVAAYDDQDALDQIASSCAAVSTEFENVPADSLSYLAKFVPVRPSAACVAVAQNRIREKSFLRDHDFPVGPFAVVRSEADLLWAGAELFPAVLKVSRFGYDGKGQARVGTVDEARVAFHHLREEPCVLEKRLELDCELSVVLARSEAGVVRCFPPAENRHRHGILDVSIAPARVPDRLARDAELLARGIAERMGYVGVMGVEFFVSEGRLLVNEIAPRPHNSGHYTLDACGASQFEQQVRALAGLPLADPAAHSAAVMVNLLGEIWRGGEPDWAVLLEHPGLHLHLYGKHHPRPGRKMGHFTLTHADRDRAVADALAARRRIGIHDEA